MNTSSSHRVWRRLRQRPVREAVLRSGIACFAFAALVATAGCASEDPCGLKGSWVIKTGLVDIRVDFRKGQAEALGVIDKVTYECVGNDVIVTYRSGLMNGSSARYTLVGPDLASSDGQIMRRLR